MRGSKFVQNQFLMLYLDSQNNFLSFDIKLSTKKYKLNEKTKILFIKACTKKCVSQKWREMTRTTFVKNALTPKLFGIFEFCKKHCIRNFSWRLAVKFYHMGLKSDFLKKYFHFLVNWGSFQGQGHFWALGVIFGFYSSMPIIV